MKESTAFLILSWLSTPQSESGLESVTTYKNLGVYTNSIRLSWSLAFFNDGRDQHLIDIHWLSFSQWYYTHFRIGHYNITRSVSCSPPCFFLGCAVHWRVRKRPYNELHGHPCTGKAITTTMQVWGVCSQNLHVYATKKLHTRSVLFLAHVTQY